MLVKEKGVGVYHEKEELGVFILDPAQDQGGSTAYVQSCLGTYESQGRKGTHIHSQGQFRIRLFIY